MVSTTVEYTVFLRISTYTSLWYNSALILIDPPSETGYGLEKSCSTSSTNHFTIIPSGKKSNVADKSKGAT